LPTNSNSSLIFSCSIAQSLIIYLIFIGQVNNK
jgi:hypothetical protein